MRPCTHTTQLKFVHGMGARHFMMRNPCTCCHVGGLRSESSLFGWTLHLTISRNILWSSLQLLKGQTIWHFSMKFIQSLTGALSEGAPWRRACAFKLRIIGPWKWKEDSLALNGEEVDCSSIQVRRFAGKSFPEIELELPGGNWMGWDVMCSCSTCTMTGGGRTTVLAARAHPFSLQRCSFFFFAFLEA